MTTLNDFKALRASVPAEVQIELYSLWSVLGCREISKNVVGDNFKKFS